MNHDTHRAATRFSLLNLIITVSILALALALASAVVQPASGESSRLIGFVILAACLFGLGLSLWFRQWLIAACLFALCIAARLLILPTFG